jgi:putative transposase
MSDNLTAEDTIISAWRMSEKNRPIMKKLIFHSDRGVQYECTDFTNIVNSYGGLVLRSMSRKGDCWDNVVAESFIKTLKAELVYPFGTK